VRSLTDEERALVEQHLPLVPQVLSRVTAHYPRHADREELAQAARLGLVEAAIRYDAARGVPFGSWAAVRVRGAILDAVRALDFAPRTLRSAERDVLVAREELLVRLGRLATEEEVAAHLGIPPERLVRIQGRVHRSQVLSLDAPCGSEGGQPVTLATGLVDEHLQPLEALEERERVHYVLDALACLPPRLQDVVVASFLDDEPLTDIARRMGVTESRVSQMRGEALALVREAVSAQYRDARPPSPVPSPGRSARRRDAYAAAVAGRSTFGTRLTSRVPLQRVG
jgi:RNA polymerase sigma factor for flagellar operon FliA